MTTPASISETAAISPMPERDPIELRMFNYHKRGCTRPAMGGDCSCGIDELTRTFISMREQLDALRRAKPAEGGGVKRWRCWHGEWEPIDRDEMIVPLSAATLADFDANLNGDAVVRASDYDALSTQLAAVREELRVVREALTPELLDVLDTAAGVCECEGFESESNAIRAMLSKLPAPPDSSGGK